MVEVPPEIAEFERLNLPMIVKFVRATLRFLSEEFEGFIPPYIIFYGLGKYGCDGYCEEEDGELTFITFDVFSDDFLDTICHEYAHALGFNEEQAVSLAQDWCKVIREHSIAG